MIIKPYFESRGSVTKGRRDHYKHRTSWTTWGYSPRDRSWTWTRRHRAPFCASRPTTKHQKGKL